MRATPVLTPQTARARKLVLAMKFFIGPMSKNVVDAVIEYADREAVSMTLMSLLVLLHEHWLDG